MIVLGIDFEATGTDPNKDFITEIGAVLFDDEDWFPLIQYSALIKDGVDALSEEASEVSGITKEMLLESGVSFKEGITSMWRSLLPHYPEYFVAHNKGFDEVLFKKEMARVFTEPLEMLNIPWLCTMTELPHPERYKCRKLSHLALDYGVGIPYPSSLHRADQDVLLMGKMLKAGFYTVQSFLNFKNTKWVYIHADIVKPWVDGGEQKDEAKKLGYSWERVQGMEEPYFKNMWIKRVAEKDLLKEKDKDCPFPRRIVEVKL